MTGFKSYFKKEDMKDRENYEHDRFRELVTAVD